MTICPMTGFKKPGFFYKVSDFLNNTLSLKDIVSNDTFNRTQSILYNEPIAQQIGRCFSLKNNSGYEVNTGPDLVFSTSNDLKAYFHSEGDELWLSAFQAFPFKVASITLDITKWQNISLVMVSITQENSVIETKPEFVCKNYATKFDREHKLFAACCEKSLWANISRDINCTVAEMRPIIPANSTMKECNDDSIAKHVYWQYLDLLQKFITESSKYGCPVPCRQTFYRAEMKYYHKNNALLPDPSKKYDGYFTMYLYYSSFMIEEKIESLEYDLQTFWCQLEETSASSSGYHVYLSYSASLIGCRLNFSL